MLNNEDIQKLMEVFATKEEIKEMISTLSTKEDFRSMQTSLDTYAQRADTYFQEMTALAHKVDRHEKWLKQVADKLGIKLEY